MRKEKRTQASRHNFVEPFDSIVFRIYNGRQVRGHEHSHSLNHAFSILIAVATMAPRLEDDAETLRHAAKLQESTLEALYRIQNQASATKEIGCTSLEELQQQREHLDTILAEGDRLEVSLKTSDKLLNQYSRGSLMFYNKRGALRLTAKEQKTRKKLEEKAEERAARIQMEYESPNNEIETSKPAITKHGKAKTTERYSQPSREGKKKDDSKETRKSLLYGIAAVEHSDELKQLEQGDADIELQLEGIGKQIDELVRMSDEMASSVNYQNKCLQEVDQQLERANTKQRVSNHRSRWFLSGKKRESHERQDFFKRNTVRVVAQ